jgi:hypothetical protein
VAVAIEGMKDTKSDDYRVVIRGMELSAATGPLPRRGEARRPG